MEDDAAGTGSRGAKRQPAEDFAGTRTRKQAKGPSHQDLRKHPIAIRVGVGLESETFHCFVALLRRTSLFFRDQLSEPNPPSLEILTRLDLPSEVPAVFARYHEWLDKDRLWTEDKDLELLRPYDLAHLFCFAERIQALRFKNVVIDTLHERTRLLTRQITTNNKDGTKQNHGVFLSYYRAAHWISANAGANSALYTYIVDFFAYFVLQTVPSFKHEVLNDLHTSFLWQVQNAVTAALQRLVPNGPPPTPAHESAATATTATAPIMIEDSPEDDAPAVPSPTPTPAPAPAPPPLRATAPISLPTPDLIQSILVGSATLRMLAKTALQKQAKAEKKGTKGKQKDDGGRSSVFGVDDLCKYHIHFDPHKAAACARAFASRADGQGVWVCGLVMREVVEEG